MRKNSRMSSTVAASRSSIDPMVECAFARILKTHLEQPQKTVNVRLIVVTQTLFFLHGFALIIEVLLRGRRVISCDHFPARARAATGCGQSLKIICAFTRSRAVHRTAGVRNVLKVRGFRDVPRNLENIMCSKEMSETCAPLTLVSRADIVIDGNRHDWDGMVFVQNNAQAVL